MVVTMETTFYEDHASYLKRDKVAQRKKEMTLNLSSEVPKISTNSILTSPDLHMLKLASPELEKLIIENGACVTTTPTPYPYEVFAKCATEEQENYAQGFVAALEKVRQSDQTRNDAVQASYTTLDVPVSSTSPQQMMAMQMDYAVTSTTAGRSPAVSTIVKDEPQTVPMVEPPVSPINMDRQEHIKLERKRERNRIAASKCRQRKLEKISRLEGKVAQLKNENTELHGIVNKLRDQVYKLKQEVMEHYNNGCSIMVSTSM